MRGNQLIPIILAYQRPELTSKLLTRLHQINFDFQRKNSEDAFSRIVLAHDGLEDRASADTRRDHEQTRQLCRDLEIDEVDVTALLFDKNIGLTKHIFRCIDAQAITSRDCIIVEEDKFPTLEAIEFLKSRKTLMDPSCILDSLPIKQHLDLELDYISTLFTDNGNLVIGDEILNLAKELWIKKDSFQDEFEKNLHFYFSSFLTGFSLRRAHRFFSDYLSWGLMNSDRPDSLFAYALILRKKLKICPTLPLSENWSDRDTRGKNINYLLPHRGKECKAKSIEIWNLSACPQCEKFGISERVGLTRYLAMKNSVNFRMRNFRKV